MLHRSTLMLAAFVTISVGAGCKTETTTTTVPPGKPVSVTKSDGADFRPTDPGGPRKQPQFVSVQPLPGATSALVGKPVRISFRRDALGLASASIPEPTASTITGRPVQ